LFVRIKCNKNIIWFDNNEFLAGLDPGFSTQVKSAGVFFFLIKPEVCLHEKPARFLKKKSQQI
jgi:hypothetical protein